MTPFLILGVLIIKGDVIIYFSIMDKIKNKKRPDKKNKFLFVYVLVLCDKKMAYNTSSLTHPRV